eukprot:TRINITY_DN30462_c0_g1_i1.p1 TRINITY_DN30462_c0_g1~~TRINITY_DN30462_c0_g1_i1.p1  ORF type:complete len:972 (+),score=237.85 TRINITY_DN30462_c0_g1_i1:123-3038(+)
MAALLESVLWPFARTLQFAYVDVPRGVTSLPFVPGLLTVLTVYGIAQAICLVVVFGNTLLAALSTKVVGFVAGGGRDDIALDALHQPLRSIVFIFVYFSVFRVLMFFCYSKMVVMMEMVYDFPTVKSLMLGRHGTRRRDNEKGTQTRLAMDRFEGVEPTTPDALRSPGADSSLDPSPAAMRAGSYEDGEPEDAAQSERKTRRFVVVVAPWLLMIVLLLALVVIGGVCEEWLLPGGRDDRFCDFVEAPKRFNRNLRFALVIVACQLMQAWLCVFPRWHVALARARFGPALLLSLATLIAVLPATLLRGLSFVGTPLGLAVEPLEPRLTYFFDCGLLIGWSVWALLTTLAIVDRGVVAYTGFSLTRLSNDSEWKTLSANFKLTLWWAHFVQGARGCMAQGVNHAINDMVSVGILYPLAFCIMWSVTFISMRIYNYADTSSKQWMLGCSFVVLLVVARLLCSFAAPHLGNLPLLVIFVWLHTSAQSLATFRTWSRWVLSLRKAVLFKRQETQQRLNRAKSIKFAVNMETAWELRLFSVIFRALLIAVITFCSVLVITVVLASFQQKQNLYLDDIVWWRNTASGIEITNAGASVLTLSLAAAKGSGSGNVPRGSQESTDHDYMLCGQSWHGLQLVDYALLSELPYVRDKPQNNITGLLSRLMPHKDLTITKVHSSGRRPWIEMELRRKKKPPVTIISVSGTVLDRVSDYLEDIRMWTEPVVLQILSTLFPAVRAWPRETTALVFGSMQQLMNGLGVQDDEWHYAEILDYVRRLPAEREVVLTGHSLGGGIALVVGALTKRTAIALQPPGVYHSLAKHQAIQRETAGLNELHRRSMSLLVEGDMISHFDLHGGLVQTIVCDQKKTSFAAGCHLLEGSICHLLRHCGDKAERFDSCNHSYDPAQTGAVVAREAATIARNSWHTLRAELLSDKAHIQAVGLAGAAASLFVTLRYGAPWIRQVSVASASVDAATKPHAD